MIPQTKNNQLCSITSWLRTCKNSSTCLSCLRVVNDLPPTAGELHLATAQLKLSKQLRDLLEDIVEYGRIIWESQMYENRTILTIGYLLRYYMRSVYSILHWDIRSVSSLNDPCLDHEPLKRAAWPANTWHTFAQREDVAHRNTSLSYSSWNKQARTLPFLWVQVERGK